MITASTMLDLDGVVNPFVDPFYPFLIEHEVFLSHATDKEVREWVTWHHPMDVHGLTLDHFLKVLDDFARSGGFTSQPAFPGVSDALWRLWDAGHDIHVVTDRPHFVYDETQQWLWDNDIPFSSLTISRDKTVFMNYGRGPYYAIDDRIENVQSLRDAEINAYLLTWPWNVDANLPRVASVNDYVDIVLDECKTLVLG